MIRQPAIDTRPIPLELLIDDARAIVRGVHELLLGMRAANEARPCAPKVDDPWAAADPDRTHRIIMIDGVRGTGKTSIQLTLLHHWRRAQKGLATSAEERELFQEVGEVVRALPALDFDPHPPTIHPYAWIVQALQPLVEKIAPTESASARRRLADMWSSLYRDALLAWSSEHAHTRELEEFVIDQRDAQSAWHYLKERWTELLDRLIEELERNDYLPRGGLIVLPIDDLDLTPALAGDLLLALRLLRHDRLVFLISGHRKRLTEVLAWELEGKLQKVNRGKLESPTLTRAATAKLAEDIVEKVIPRAHTVAARLLSLEEAIGHRFHGHGTLRERLMGDPLGRELLEVIGRQIVRATPRCFRYRDVLGLVADSGITGVELVRELLCRAIDEAGLPLFERGARPDQLSWSGAGDQLSFRAVQSDHQEPVGAGLARQIDFYLDNAADPAHPLLLIAAELALDREYLSLARPQWARPISTPIAFTVFRTELGDLVLGWPEFEGPTSPQKAVELLEAWKARAASSPRVIEERLRECIRFQLERRGFFVPGRTTGADWPSLLDEIRVLAKREDQRAHELRNFVSYELALLIAPEYGLGKLRRRQLLDWILALANDDGLINWSSVVPSLDEIRTQRIRAFVPDLDDNGLVRVLTVLARSDQQVWANKSERFRKRWFWEWESPESDRSALYFVRAMEAGTDDPSAAMVFSDQELSNSHERDHFSPNWAAKRMSAILDVPRLRERWCSGLDTIQNWHTPMVALCALWRVLLETFDVGPRETMLGWIAAGEDGRSLKYSGPDVIFKLERGEAVVPGKVWTLADWSLEPDFFGLAPEASRAVQLWLMMMHWVVARHHSVPRMRVEAPPVYGQISSPKFQTWWAADRWRSRWVEVCRTLAGLRSSNALTESTESEWLLANYLASPLAGFRNAYSYPRFPVAPNIFNGIAKSLRNFKTDAAVRNYLLTIDLEHLASPESFAAWREGLSS